MSEPVRMIVTVEVHTGNTTIVRDVDVQAKSANQPDSRVFELAVAKIGGQITGMLRGLEPTSTVAEDEGRVR